MLLQGRALGHGILHEFSSHCQALCDLSLESGFQGRDPQLIDGITLYFQPEAVAEEGLLPWEHSMAGAVSIQSQKVFVLPVEQSPK